MKRVLQLSYTLALAGTEMVIMNWYRNIDRNKLQFDFVVCKEDKLYFKPEVESKGGRVFIVKKNPGLKGLLNFYRGLYRTIKDNGPYEAFHTHAHYSAGLDCLVAFLAGVKKRFVISHFAAGIGPMKDTPFYKKAIARILIAMFATDCLAVSKDAGETLYGGKPCLIIKNGIDLDYFSYNEEIRRKKRMEMSLSDKFVIGNIGRFTEQKNQSFLLDVFARISEQESNAVLLLAGVGPLEGYLKKKAEDLKLGDRVRFLGEVKDTAALYNALDCFVFPSIFEGFGIVALEAQASGLPCFVSEEVPQEARIVNTVSIPISFGPNRWAEIIIASTKGFKRKCEKEKIKAAGYDTKDIAKTIGKEYLK